VRVIKAPDVRVRLLKCPQRTKCSRSCTTDQVKLYKIIGLRFVGRSQRKRVDALDSSRRRNNHSFRRSPERQEADLAPSKRRGISHSHLITKFPPKLRKAMERQPIRKRSSASDELQRAASVKIAKHMPVRQRGRGSLPLVPSRCYVVDGHHSSVTRKFACVTRRRRPHHIENSVCVKRFKGRRTISFFLLGGERRSDTEALECGVGSPLFNDVNKSAIFFEDVKSRNTVARKCRPGRKPLPALNTTLRSCGRISAFSGS